MWYEKSLQLRVFLMLMLITFPIQFFLRNVQFDAHTYIFIFLVERKKAKTS